MREVALELRKRDLIIDILNSNISGEEYKMYLDFVLLPLVPPAPFPAVVSEAAKHLALFLFPRLTIWIGSDHFACHL